MCIVCERLVHEAHRGRTVALVRRVTVAGLVTCIVAFDTPWTACLLVLIATWRWGVNEDAIKAGGGGQWVAW